MITQMSETPQLTNYQKYRETKIAYQKEYYFYCNRFYDNFKRYYLSYMKYLNPNELSAPRKFIKAKEDQTFLRFLLIKQRTMRELQNKYDRVLSKPVPITMLKPIEPIVEKTKVEKVKEIKEEPVFNPFTNIKQNAQGLFVLEW